MSKRIQSLRTMEVQRERLTALCTELENKEMLLREREEELKRREHKQDVRELTFFESWQAQDDDHPISNSTDEIMRSLRDVVDGYTASIAQMRQQMDVMAAACCNAVAKVLEMGARDGAALYETELANAMFASYVDNRSFRDVSDASMLEHSLLTIDTPEELERLGTYGFRNNPCIRRIELPDGMRVLPASFFFGCSRLVEVVLPDSLERIEDYAFYGCTRLRNVRFGGKNRLREIGRYAFSLCDNLKSVELPATLERIGDGAFRACESLEAVSFSPEIAALSIGSHLFQNCRKLREMELPETVEEIPISMFFGCTGLTKVRAAGAKRIRPFAFYGDESLDEIVLGDALEMDDTAFRGTSAKLQEWIENNYLVQRKHEALLESEAADPLSPKADASAPDDAPRPVPVSAEVDTDATPN